MSSSHDSRPVVSLEGRATSKPEAGSEENMVSLWPARRPARILVVDDQPSIAGLMSQLLTMRGYEVVTAADAQQAQAEVRRQAPDLILSDVRMPGNTGYALFTQL